MKNTKKNTQNKNSQIIIIALGLVALVTLGFAIKGIISASSGSTTAVNSSTTVTANLNDGVQEVKMNVTASGYSPSFIVVKKGLPVRIVTDSTSDAGCVRGFMLPDLNINKALEVGKDRIDLTFNKTGQYAFSCQMKMSTGTIKVID